MERLIHSVVRLLRAGQSIYAKKRSFFVVFLFTFIANVVVLSMLDLLPGASAPATVSTNTSSTVDQTDAVLVERVELPIQIEIPRINLSTSVSNPTTTTVALLDQALLSGAVRYPTSAKLGEQGNVVLFGHSSYLPIVKNKAYKTFNDIQKLSAGDVITVYATDTAFTYRVRSVSKESAESAAIPLDVDGRVLTLSTCDSFGVKSDRFVVIADFVDSHSIRS